jgi:hypothetical protein
MIALVLFLLLAVEEPCAPFITCPPDEPEPTQEANQETWQRPVWSDAHCDKGWAPACNQIFEVEI